MKIKTLIIIGLTAFLCLFGATAHAQSDNQIINMDNSISEIILRIRITKYQVL